VNVFLAFVHLCLESKLPFSVKKRGDKILKFKENPETVNPISKKRNIRYRARCIPTDPRPWRQMSSSSVASHSPSVTVFMQ